MNVLWRAVLLFLIAFIIISCQTKSNHVSYHGDDDYVPKSIITKKYRLDFSGISYEKFKGAKHGSNDYLMAYLSDSETSLLSKKDFKNFSIKDSFLTIHTKKGPVTFTTTNSLVNHDYMDTFVYRGKLQGTNYVIIHEVFGELKNCIQLVNLNTGEVVFAWQDVIFSGNVVKNGW